MDEDELFEERKVKSRRVTTALISVVLVIALAFGAAVLVKKYVLSRFTVDGISMYPTLDGGGSDPYDGEILLLNKIAKIRRGDIVVFRYDWDGNDRPLVKRVIGLGGDKIDIRSGRVYVNGEELNEDYLPEEMTSPDMSVTVEKDHYFCMGDNRNNSFDSRMIGQVPAQNVVGKCVFVLDRSGGLRLPN